MARHNPLAAGRAGLTWTAETLVPSLENPTGFPRAHLSDPRVRSPTNFQLRAGAADLVADLASLGG